MEDLDDFLEFMDMAEVAHTKIPKRYIRDHSNPFEFLYEEAFKKRFKFSKEAIMYYILPIIEGNLAKDSNRGLPVPPVLQLLMALRFYATGNYQAVTGDLRGFTQPTVCRCIKAVSIAFAEKLHEYVQFPKTLEDQRSNIRTFYEIAEFPNVAACIDGTLIKIANPDKEIGEIFRSRKGSFSLNILAAAGPRGEILYIDVRHPGSTHDSTCFDRSALKLFFMENRIKDINIKQKHFKEK
ncbi:putative nuclease HARBI1 [Temnothorax curvispinosus]|uniref:Nuclease HARBI1 n=1 Tax=Temnothorax curvispinosus TaxID=300111 RepID=A0A6J1PY22_9HYME|nr:putative nuclease HARBI1 [Temnothorax curvispinosus]